LATSFTQGVTEDEANLIYVYPLILTFSRQGGWDLGEKRSRVILYRHSRMDLQRQVAQDQRTDLFSECKRLAGLLLRRPDLQILADLHRIIGRFGQFLQAQFGDRFELLAQASQLFRGREFWEWATHDRPAAL
jgi:hypothetical protein